MENKELLELLLSTPSPSGYELNIQKKVIEYMNGVSDKVITQSNYNVIHVLNEHAKTKILLCSHIDEIGLVINKILDDGTCRVERIGGVNPYNYIAQHIYVVHDSSLVKGVVTYLPNMDKGIETSDLIIDLGTQSKEETKKLVSVGDPIIHQTSYNYLNNNMLTGKALDDKLAVYIFLSLMKRLKGKTDLGIYVATTVGEETTCRGIDAAIQNVKPTCVIASDVAFANDINYRSNLSGDIALGKGPIFTIGSVINKKLDEMFVKSAEKLNISYQREIAPSRTFTDADKAYNFNEATPTYLVSIPLRYMHSSVEMCNLNDIKQIIDVFEDVILNFKEDTSFNPFE